MAHDIGTTGEQKTQRERHTQHPLTHRLVREYFVDEEGCTLGHAPSATACRWLVEREYTGFSQIYKHGPLQNFIQDI